MHDTTISLYCLSSFIRISARHNITYMLVNLQFHLISMSPLLNTYKLEDKLTIKEFVSIMFHEQASGSKREVDSLMRELENTRDALALAHDHTQVELRRNAQRYLLMLSILGLSSLLSPLFPSPLLSLSPLLPSPLLSLPFSLIYMYILFHIESWLQSLNLKIWNI